MQSSTWVRNLLSNVRKIISIYDNEDFNKDFPGGPEVKNLYANAGDMDLIPDPRRSLRPQNNEAYAPQLLNQCFRAHVL